MFNIHLLVRGIARRVDLIPRKLQRLICLFLIVLILKLFCSETSLLSCVTVKFPNFIFNYVPPFSSICSSPSIPFCIKSAIDEHEQAGCNVPILEPFHESIKRFTTALPTKKAYCKEIPLLFNSTLDSEVVPVVDTKGFKKYGIVSCCYKVISRKEDEGSPDNFFRYSDQCHAVSLTNATTIPDDHEFIAIFCWDKKNRTQIHDMHAFVSLKPEVKEILTSPPSPDRLNVAILGLDSLSRMNFLRTMPMTHNYIMNDLSGVELQGYNKNGMNTFLCLLPMLTSKYFPEISKSCGKTKFYDTCPLIWKKYKAKGYITALAEDWASVAIFHYNKNGFHYSPTDYFLRPLAVAAQKEFNKGKNQPIHCQGPRYSIQSLLQYMQKVTHKMDLANKSYFHFTWATSMTHTYLHYSKLIDKDVFEFLKWFKDNGHLKNTVLVLMSDHGIYWGDIRKTVQGQLEARLPFIYYILPESFKIKYPRAYQNLLGNKRRLTSALDIHYTLRDLANITLRLGNDELANREAILDEAREKGNLPQGISQFLPIPVERTCGDAGIQEFYCSCKEGIKEVSPKLSIVQEIAHFVVDELNRKIRKHKRCAHLELRNVTLAQFIRTKDGVKNGTLRPAYLINFETSPGNGGFEAFVVEYEEKVKTSRWKLSGSVSRSSLYGNQSYCVDDTELKYYCFCKK